TLVPCVCQRQLMLRHQTLSEWLEKSGSRELWPSTELHATNRANGLAHGSSIASTKGKSLSLADTCQTIRLIRLSLATTNPTTNCTMPRKSETVLSRVPLGSVSARERGWKSTCAPSLIYPSVNGRNGR